MVDALGVGLCDLCSSIHPMPEYEIGSRDKQNQRSRDTTNAEGEGNAGRFPPILLCRLSHEETDGIDRTKNSDDQ